VNVPGIVSAVAQAGGQTAPSYVNAAVDGTDLSFHIGSNTAVISSSPQSGRWDYVVLQDYSTRPTDIPNVGDPLQSVADAKTLYGLVKANSANVKPILYETWSRQPGNPDLNTWYPAEPLGSAPNQYMAAAVEMQSELHKYYYQSRANIGATVCGLAPVGDAFEQLGFAANLYQSDEYHESTKGGLMAGLLIYEQIYKAKAADISYAAMNGQLTLSSYGISDAAEWTAFATLADTETAAVPEPMNIALLGLGLPLLLRRRRA
jgi:hypothetical protein